MGKSLRVSDETYALVMAAAGQEQLEKKRKVSVDEVLREYFSHRNYK